MSRARLALSFLVILLAIGSAWRLLDGDERAGPGADQGRVARPAGAAPLAVAPPPTPRLDGPPSPDAGGLEIRVTTAGAPVQGASVRLYLHQPLEPGTGRPGWRLAGETPTDGGGLAQLAAGPGAYLVSVRSVGLAPGLETVVRPAGERVTRVAVGLVPPLALDGRVLERGSREPVPATALLLSREPERGAPRGDLPAEERTWASSDGRGRFRLAPLAPGRYALEAEAAGHARLRLGGLTVPRTGELEVTLSAAGLVEGRVLDPAGAPADGAEVDFTGGEQVLVVRAGPSGGFAAELPPRAYRVAARRGEAATALPAPLSVAAGQTVRDLVLRLGRPASIQGQVVTSGDSPVAGASLGLSPADDPGELGRATSGADGRFAFRGLAPGAYDLDAGAEGFASLVRRGLQVAAGELFELRVVLPGTGAVEGAVSDGGGRPVAGARVRAGGFRGGLERFDAEAVTGDDGRYLLQGIEPGRTSVKARRAEALSGPSRLVVVEEGRTAQADFTLRDTGSVEGIIRAAGGGAPTDPVRAVLFQTGPGPATPRAPDVVAADGEGRFTAVVPEGSWRVSAMGEGGARLRARSAEVEVRAGGTARVELQLEEDSPASGGTLTVEVREPDGAPSPFAEVVTLRGSRSRRSFPTDDLGRATLPLVSGTAALEPLSVGARNGGRSAPLRPVPPTTPAQLIQLLPAGLLRGQVLEGGRPVTGVTLELSGAEELQRELPGADFAFADLAPGLWQLTAITPDGRTGTATATVASGAETMIRVEVSLGATVSGRVVDQAGAPVGGAFVSAGERDLGGQGTGTDGRFRISGVLPGAAVAIKAGLPRRGGAERTVALAPGQALELGDLVLEPSSSAHHP